MARDTSIAAYNKIRSEGLLSKQRLEAYELLFKHGPATAAELWQYSPRKDIQKFRPANINRLGELRDMGAVKEVGTRICAVTGNKVILWDVTSELPKKIGRKKDSKVEQAIKEERAACAAIAFDHGNSKIGNLIVARSNRNLFDI